MAGELGQSVGTRKMREGTGTPLQTMLVMHLISWLNVLKNTFFKMEEEFNDLMID